MRPAPPELHKPPGFYAKDDVSACGGDDVGVDDVDLDADAKATGFYEKYPYFAKLAVPAKTYRGVAKKTPSFQDSALWVANANVPEDIVYKILSAIYTDEGLAHMVSQKKTFKEMKIATGTNGIVTPMHPGAIKFWKEKGML